MAGEAVTLQLGQFAGCVGTHWWGLQAAALRSPAETPELHPAALLRPGRAAGGRETHTPRLVALELKGGLGALGPRGAGAEAAAAWDGAVADYLEHTPTGGSAAGDAGRRTAFPQTDQEGPALLVKGGTGPLGHRGTWLALDQPVVHQDPEVLLPRAAPQQVFLLPLHNSLFPRMFPWAAAGRSGLITSTCTCIPKVSTSSLSTCTMGMSHRDCGCLEAFGQGESLLQDPGCLEELEDRLHFYVEECDYLQGFQVLCDLHNGFSGVGAKVTELLCDEYSGKGILTWGLTPVTSNVGDSQKNFYRLMNTALGIVHLSSHSSLFCPLSLSGSLGIRPRPPVSFPYINYDASLNYHSSAILAAVLDTLTAPYRLSSFQGSMMHLAETLNFSGRKVVAAWASVPFPALRGCSLFDTLCTYKQDVPWKLLSSCREQKVSCCFAQSVVLRGICKESHLSCSGKQPESLLHMWESTEQILQRYLHTVFPGAFRWVTGCRFGTGSSNWPTVLSNVIPLLPYSTALVLEQPCHTQPPYPQFFSPLLTREGFLLDRPPRYPSAAVESIPVLAALQASPVLHTLLYSLYKDLQKLNTQRWASFFSAGVEHDDFQEALEQLRTLSQCYETGFEADESEDEGDSD
ncbi:protein misato homolog 1 isoform X2 [Apus apus]|uniref:protein misato homolog 1 isoform X2 n=1 Tax=Apus apus TaxID=8895 RepID=UPI0021F8A696|nr:protein misato homolog 1 isoform X2 [Apus apus]